MYIFITVLIIIVCILLSLIVLVQNPKGGGLSAQFGGFNNQIMGVKRTTDFLEKSTWTLAIALLGFGLLSNFFIPKENRSNKAPKSEFETKLGNSKVPVMPTAPTAPPANAPSSAPAGQPQPK